MTEPIDQVHAESMAAVHSIRAHLEERRREDDWWQHSFLSELARRLKEETS